jgi:predicted protein tyrosine phosphatase
MAQVQHVVASTPQEDKAIAPQWPAVKIYDHLYIGSYKNAQDVEYLRNLGITAVIDCAHEYRIMQDLCRKSQTDSKERKVAEPSIDLDFLFLNWLNERHIESKFFKDLNCAIDFIDRHKNKGGKVLVHCHMGISRAPAVALAYLMRKEDWTYEQAIAKLRCLPGAIIIPNPWFEDMLICWE